MRGAEAVLEGPHDALRVEAFALEREDRVHEVLERLRARERPVLRDVPDQEDGDARRLRERLQSRLAHSRTCVTEPAAAGAAGDAIV